MPAASGVFDGPLGPPRGAPDPPGFCDSFGGASETNSPSETPSRISTNRSLESPSLTGRATKSAPVRTQSDGFPPAYPTAWTGTESVDSMSWTRISTRADMPGRSAAGGVLEDDVGRVDLEVGILPTVGRVGQRRQPLDAARERPIGERVDRDDDGLADLHLVERRLVDVDPHAHALRGSGMLMIASRSRTEVPAWIGWPSR